MTTENHRATVPSVLVPPAAHRGRGSVEIRNPSRHVPSRLWSLSSSGLCLALAVLSGCTGKIGDGATGGEAGVEPERDREQAPERVPAPEREPAGGMPPMLCDSTVRPGRAPLRRLTRFEYNNTVRDLFGDTTDPPTCCRPKSRKRLRQRRRRAVGVEPAGRAVLSAVAEGVARARRRPGRRLAKLAPCAMTVHAAETEEACAKHHRRGADAQVVPTAARGGRGDAPRAGEVVRAHGRDVRDGIAAVIQAAAPIAGFSLSPRVGQLRTRRT